MEPCFIQRDLVETALAVQGGRVLHVVNRGVPVGPGCIGGGALAWRDLGGGAIPAATTGEWRYKSLKKEAVRGPEMRVIC